MAGWLGGRCACGRPWDDARLVVTNKHGFALGAVATGQHAPMLAGSGSPKVLSELALLGTWLALAWGLCQEHHTPCAAVLWQRAVRLGKGQVQGERGCRGRGGMSLSGVSCGAQCYCGPMHCCAPACERAGQGRNSCLRSRRCAFYMRCRIALHDVL